jgi:hypothetical protein
MTNEDRVKAGLRPLGRPPVNTPPEFQMMSNGLYVHQWDWLKEYGRSSVPPRDGAEIQRMAVQWFIDATEASRNSFVPTPEQDQDFEKLLSLKSKKTSKSTKSTKSTKEKLK